MNNYTHLGSLHQRKKINVELNTCCAYRVCGFSDASCLRFKANGMGGFIFVIFIVFMTLCIGRCMCLCKNKSVNKSYNNNSINLNNYTLLPTNERDEIKIDEMINDAFEAVN